MNKLIISDLDGTLIGKEEILTDTALKVAARVAELGYGFTLATGRTQELAREFAQGLGITVPYIVSNGAKVMEGREVVWERTIPLIGLRETMETGVSLGMSLIYTIDGVEYVHEETDWIRGQQAKFDRYHRIAPISEDDWDRLVVEKVTIMDPIRDGRIDKIEALSRALDGRYSSTKYTDKAVELVHGEASKARALQVVLDLLGVAPENTIAFGDHQNDIPMLKMAGTGVAVGNAIPEVKEVADVVTDESGADGVLSYLMRLQ